MNIGDLKASVIVPTWNRKEILRLVLEALAVQDTGPSAFEVLVCDSESDDGTDGMVRDFQRDHPELSIAHLHTFNALTAKRNAGMAAARSNVVAFLDDDCVPTRSWLSTHLAELAAAGPRAFVCGEVRYPDDWVRRSNYFWFRDSRHYAAPGGPADVKELDERTIVAMNMVARKDELLDGVGPFDERFRTYGCEDHEFGWRARRAGFRIRTGAARILHYETTGSIAGYERKMFVTARDAVPVVARDFPELLPRIAPKPIEPLFYAREATLRGRVQGAALTLLFLRPLVGAVRAFAVATDRLGSFRFAPVYRYLMAAAYWRGAVERTRGVSRQVRA